VPWEAVIVGEQKGEPNVQGGFAGGGIQTSHNSVPEADPAALTGKVTLPEKGRERGTKNKREK